jgi:hypothetical protein
MEEMPMLAPLPALDSPEAQIAWLRAEREASRVRAMAEPIHDAASFLEATGHTDRNNGPWMLFDCYLLRRIGPADMAAIVADVWSAAEWPQSHMTVALWCELFHVAAYPEPAEPLTLYRGATPGRARGMAWTTDLKMARWFASRMRAADPRPAYVYTVTAPPEAVLAVMDDVEPDGRAEHEVVVDPRRLPKVARFLGTPGPVAP